MTFRYHNEISVAVELDRVPPFSFASVERRAAATKPALPSRKRYAFIAILVLALPCLAIAAATTPDTKIWQDLAAQLRRHNIRMIMAKSVIQPTTSLSIERAMSRAAFHLVLPTDLPAGTKFVDIEEQGTDGTLYTATYRLADGRRTAFIFQKKERGHGYVPWIGEGRSGPNGTTSNVLRPASIWFVGDEVVTAATDRFTAGQIDTIKRAMHGIDPPNHSGLVVVH